MNSETNSVFRLIKTLLLVAFGLFLAFEFIKILLEIWSVISTVTIPFDTDEADHANAGWELYFFLSRGDFWGVWNAFIRQSFYPPLHSIIVAISYIVWGASYFSSRASSLLLYSFSALSLAIVAFRFCREQTQSSKIAVFASLLSLLGFLACPIAIENSALCMLELLGVFLSIIFIGLIVSNRFMLATIALVLLTFSKFSFGIFLGMGWFAFLLCRLFLIRNFREFSFHILIFIMPLICWAVLSDAGSMWWFIVGHPSYDPILSSENLFFELRAWINNYSATRAQGLVYFIGFIYGSYLFRKEPRIQALFLITLTAFSLLLLSTTNEARHFIIVAPIIWFVASAGVGIALDKGKISPAVQLGLALILCFLVWGLVGLSSQVRGLVTTEMEGKAGYDKLADFIFDRVSSNEPILFIGPFDQFGIEYLRWKGAVRADIPYSLTRIDSFPYRDDKNLTALKRKRNLELPYKDPSKPKSPLREVLGAHYYRYLVTIRKIGSPNPKTSESLLELKEINPPKLGSVERGGIEVSVYELY